MNKWRYYFNELTKSISKGLAGYLKAIAKLALLGLVILSVGLWYFNIDWWFLKALTIAIIDLVPIVGSGLIMVPWALVHFFLGHTTLAIQLGLLYVVLVIVRQIAEPIITGREIGVRAVYTLLSTVVCGIIFGPLGAVFGAVVAIILKSVFEVISIKDRIDS